MKTFRLPLFLAWMVLISVVLAGCGSRSSRDMVLGGEVADTRTLSQDLHAYAHRAGGDTPLLDPNLQAAHWQRYTELFFRPWELDKVGISASDAFAPLKSAGYAENLLPRSQADMREIVRNSAQESYPNRFIPAVTVRATPLRAAPTARPRFNNPLQAGQGFPFDMWQYATLPAGMPLLVTHASRDGAWLFVENALVGGWLAEQDVAFANEQFREHYRQHPLAAVVRENTVFTENTTGRILGRAGIGTLLPTTVTDSSVRILVPVKDMHGEAVLLTAHAPAEAAVLAPMSLTPEAVAAIGNEIMGQPYGWGSLYANRDCSAMLRDVFTPFGIWLPRNSAAQARAWTYRDFEALTPQAKQDFILVNAKPFATLLWLPGHIGLYIGEQDGVPLMFHDVWGIRTETDGREGRYIIGRAVVTSLRPGIELPDVQDENGLVARMRGMSVLER